MKNKIKRFFSLLSDFFSYEKKSKSEAFKLEIITEQQHSTYINEVKTLILKNPQLGTPDSDRLELLANLIENFEDEKYGKLEVESCITT